MIQSQEQMTDAGWVVDPTLPPGFFFPAAPRPHLHVTTTMINGPAAPWNLAYLAYTDNGGNPTVIYQAGVIDNPGAIANIPVNLQDQAQFAYNLR